MGIVARLRKNRTGLRLPCGGTLGLDTVLAALTGRERRDAVQLSDCSFGL